MKPNLIPSRWRRSETAAEADPPKPVDSSAAPPTSDAELEARLAEFAETDPWTPRVGRRDMRTKLWAALRGLKHAFRGDSSFFAHSYRGLFFAITAALLGIGPHQWCLLVLAGGLVFIAELGNSAVDTLARAHGDPNAPGSVVAREIASAGVLVAVIVFVAVIAVVLVTRLTALFGW
jgi:diacylglycerol kinase